MLKRWSATAPRGSFIHAMAALLLVSCTALAQQQQKDPAALLEDFVFYTLTANPDLAAANGRALLESGVSCADLAELLDETGRTEVERFNDANERAQRLSDQFPDLANVAGELATCIENGRLDLARDPQRIDQAIEMLRGVRRAQLLGRRRLITAGEYAVPALLRQITEGRDQRLINQVVDVLIEIGREAVPPLAAALPKLGDPTAQRTVADILANIGHTQAAPVLLEVSQDPSVHTTARDAAERGFRRVGVGGGDLSDLYTELGMGYFKEFESLIANPEEATNNVWDYDWSVGLVPTPVPTEIFGEVMAMRMASKALQARNDNAQARALFVAANLKRENEMPQGAIDPVYGQSPRTPEFYATLFGTGTANDVLAMAIELGNTPLVRDAIAALAETTGGANLFEVEQGRPPLLQALAYSDRRAQYEAAITLANALPDESFPNDITVVPLLASAVRSGARLTAVIVADDREDRRVMANILEPMGFEIAGSEGSVEALQQAITAAGGIDLVVITKPSVEQVEDAIDALRLIPKTTAAPVLVQSNAIDKIELDRTYRADRRVLIGRAGLGEPQFRAQVEALMEGATGGMMDEAEAEAYAIEAVEALSDIAISRSPAFDIADAEPSLVDALNERSGFIRMRIADVLSMIDSERSQRALWDAALAATDNDQVELLERVAGSVKRFGSYAQPHHAQSLLQIIEEAEGARGEAAAQVHGAMNLPATEAVRLIPGVG